MEGHCFLPAGDEQMLQERQLQWLYTSRFVGARVAHLRIYDTSRDSRGVAIHQEGSGASRVWCLLPARVHAWAHVAGCPQIVGHVGKKNTPCRHPSWRPWQEDSSKGATVHAVLVQFASCRYSVNWHHMSWAKGFTVFFTWCLH